MADPEVVITATAQPTTSTLDNAAFAASTAAPSDQTSSESYSPTTAESTKEDEACSSPIHQRLMTDFFPIKGKATGGAAAPAKASDNVGQQGSAGEQQHSANKFAASFHASADDTSTSDAVTVTSAKPGPRTLGRGSPARTGHGLATQVAQRSSSHRPQGSAPAGAASHKQTSAISRKLPASTSKPVPCTSAATATAAAATPEMPGRAVSASNEVKSLVAFAWDSWAEMYPPNLEKIQPAQAKRKSQQPERYGDEPEKPQHAYRGAGTGKRQKAHKISLEPPFKPMAVEAQHSCHSSKNEVLPEPGPSGYTCTSTTPDCNSNTQPELPSKQQSSAAKAKARSELAPTASPVVMSPTNLVSDSYTQSVSPAAAVPSPATPRGPSPAAPAPAAPAAHSHPRSSKGNLHEGKQMHSQADISCTATGRPHALTVEQPDNVSTDQSAHGQSASVPQQSHVATEEGAGWSPAADDHTVYDNAECPCSGECCLVALVPDLPDALLPQRLRASGLHGNFLWRATYPVQEHRLGVRGDYSRLLDFQRSHFAQGAQIVLPGIKDVLQAVAYSSTSQQQTQKAKHWARMEGVSTSGQFTLWHEPPSHCRPRKEIISSMMFHLQETSAQDSSAMPCCVSAEAPHSHAVVEVMFVATDLKHRKKKFFVQLLRLFMREYLLKHYQQVDLLVMATPKATQEWGTAKLARQLGTQPFQRIDDQCPLVLGRAKCTDCNWMHLAINQSLLAAGSEDAEQLT